MIQQLLSVLQNLILLYLRRMQHASCCQLHLVQMWVMICALLLHDPLVVSWQLFWNVNVVIHVKLAAAYDTFRACDVVLLVEPGVSLILALRGSSASMVYREFSDLNVELGRGRVCLH